MIRKLILFSLIAFFALKTSISHSQESKSIVITAFEPFGGSKTNLSMPIANETSRLLEAAGFKTRVCVLPVEYDRASELALECLNGLPGAQLMISMGVAGCDVRFETQAKNWDESSMKDNAGEKRKHGSPIIAGAPDYVKFTINANFLYWQSLNVTQNEMLRRSMRISESTGSYVCNNTAYLIQHELNQKPSSPKYSFVHLPNATCSYPQNDIASISKSLAHGIEMLSRLK